MKIQPHVLPAAVGDLLSAVLRACALPIPFHSIPFHSSPSISITAGRMASSGSGELTRVSSVKCFGGYVQKFQHQSKNTNTKMTFSVYLPPKAQEEKVPVTHSRHIPCNAKLELSYQAVY